jgi:hypothetical protein
VATLKNTNVNTSGSDRGRGIILPKGTDAQRGNSTGQLRYNTDKRYLEYNDFGVWIELHGTPGAVPGNGLIAALDATDPASYPGTGTVWYDLTNNGNNFNLTNVNYDSADAGGALQTTGSTNSYGLNASTIDLRSSPYTVTVVQRYVSESGRMLNGQSNNWLLGMWDGTVGNHYAEGWISATDAGGFDTNWHVYSAVGYAGQDRYSWWWDARRQQYNSTGGSAGPQGLGFGKYFPGNSEATNGKIQCIFVHNRVLLDTEIMSMHVHLLERTRGYQ